MSRTKAAALIVIIVVLSIAAYVFISFSPKQTKETGLTKKLEASEQSVPPSTKAPKPDEVTESKPSAKAASAVFNGNRPSKKTQIDEESLMAKLRRVQDTDPSLALNLAREGNQLYPNSPYVAERAGRVVKSLALQGKFSEARGEAEKMVNDYPGTPWALEVERHTGAHPRTR